MSRFLVKIRDFYNRISNILFYVLFAFALAAAVFLTIGIKQKIAERAAIKAAEPQAPEAVLAKETLADSPIYAKLAQMGLQQTEITQIMNKLESIMYTRKLRPQDKYMVSLDKDGKFNLLVVTRDLSYYYVARVDGDYVAGIIDQEVKTKEKSASGKIQGSLFTSMQASGMQVPLIVSFTDAFAWTVDFNTETRNNDKYAVVWDETSTASGTVVGQSIAAAKYDGAAAGKNYAYYFDGEFYDGDGKISKRMFLKSPLAVHFTITSYFTYARYHPILKIMREHLGIDYAAPLGTPVQAVAAGTVETAGWHNGFGNFVALAHANGYKTTYGHLQKIMVTVGQRVRQGQTVGLLGMSGLATGPHVDFRIEQNGKFMNFLKIKDRDSETKELPKDKMADFIKVRDKYEKILDADTK